MKYTKDNPKLVEDIFYFQGRETFTGVVINERKDIVYYLNGKYHREDGSAIEYANGNACWCLYGKLHRTDGPAIYVYGTKEWWLNDKRYGKNDDFTNESWNRFVKLELLK